MTPTASNKRYETRVVQVGENNFFVEYRWIGNRFIGLLTGKDIFWTRWCNNTSYDSLNTARSAAKKALASYELNSGWNEKVVG